MARHGLTPEQEAEIVKDYLSDEWLVTTVAKRAGVSTVTVYAVLKRTGTPLRSPQVHKKIYPKNILAAWRKARAIELRAQGLYPEEIKMELGVSIQSVQGYLKKAREEAVDAPMAQA